MKVPWCAIVVTSYMLAKNALLRAPRDLFANGKLLHVTKVSARNAASDQKTFGLIHDGGCANGVQMTLRILDLKW